MVAAEFQAKIIDGRIEVPQDLREQFSGNVKVILFADGAQQDESAWPAQNRRRWELIARKVRQGLSAAEAQELAVLQRQADEQLTRLGPRPVEELERWYAELSQEG
jgi:DNA-binding transcriptional regulator/RsmH inhibitor MraZ